MLTIEFSVIVALALLLAVGMAYFGIRTRRLLRAKAEALRESQHRMRLATDSMPTLIAFLGTDLRYRFANEAYAQWSGIPADEIVGKTIPEVWDPQMFEVVREHVESAASGKEVDFETKLPLKDGGRLAVHAQLVPHRNENGEVEGLFVLATDITQLRQVENELRVSRDALRTLAGNLITVQEMERRRIARELHDDITQRLAALTMDTASIKSELQESPESVAERVDELREKIATISQDVHRISRQLHPSILEDLGLVEAIRSECKSVSDREDIDVEFDPDVLDKLSNEQELCLYRVAQESLRNVAKHAKTSSAVVRIRQDDGEVCLCVEDAGVGFGRQGVGRSGGIGLITMEERVNLCGGRLVVESEPGRGTKVVVRMRLS